MHFSTLLITQFFIMRKTLLINAAASIAGEVNASSPCGCAMPQLLHDLNCPWTMRQESTKHQFGFLPKRSTLQQLPVIAEKIIEPNKCEVNVVYMDFKKAFDLVSHNHLLDKLQSFGIPGKARRWFEAYLWNCYQCVKIGDSYSELCNLFT